MSVWTRAVIRPAARRAYSAWVGVGLVASVIGGGNGLMPHDVTHMAIGTPPLGVALAVMWALLIVPAARLLVRQDAATYLRALPGPRVLPAIIAAIALVLIQLPWLALWIAGEGARGLVAGAATTILIAGIAAIPLRVSHPKVPEWRSLGRGLAGIYARALRRRAGHVLVRGAGLALLAGATGGLIARNNHVPVWSTAAYAAGAIAIMIIPGWAGTLAPILDAHRQTAWLAVSLGATERARLRVLAATVAGVYVLGALVALVTAALVLGDPAEIAATIPVTLACSVAAALVTTRGLVWAQETPRYTAARAVTGAVVGSAVCVIALAALGAPGAIAGLACGLIAMGKAA